jgi:hypothetical protein
LTGEEPDWYFLPAGELPYFVYSGGLRYMHRFGVRALSIIALTGLFVVGLDAAPVQAQATFNNFAAFQAATSGLTSETFDAAPWSPAGVDLSQPVVNLGVSWTSGNILIATSIISLSPSQSITDIDDTPEVIDILRAQLPGGITAVGGFVNNIEQAHGVTLTAFSSSNDVLGQVTSPSGTSTWFFVGLTTTAPIARVTFESTQGGIEDDFALDNFSFGQALTRGGVAAPEPGALALLVLGLTGQVTLRRAGRRRSW